MCNDFQRFRATLKETLPFDKIPIQSQKYEVNVIFLT